MKTGYDFSRAKKVDIAKFKNCKFEIVDYKVNKFRDKINEILSEIGYPEALVSDFSEFRDFALDKKDYKKLSKKFGMKIKENTLLVDVASQLFKKK